MRDSCGNSESKGDPTGASAPRADCPTFQSTSKFVKSQKKTVDKLDFHRVCLQFELSIDGFFFLIFKGDKVSILRLKLF